MLIKSQLRTPLGTLYLVAHEHVLLAAGFSSFDDLVYRMDPREAELKFSSMKTIPIISELLEDYFNGDLRALDGIQTRQPGAPFSQAAWRAMRKIAPGKVLSYAVLAERAGSPDAVRAAGSACARNLIAPIIPCHRVVKTGGSLGNYGYGLTKKEWLLRHEGAL